MDFIDRVSAVASTRQIEVFHFALVVNMRGDTVTAPRISDALLLDPPQLFSFSRSKACVTLAVGTGFVQVLEQPQDTKTGPEALFWKWSGGEARGEHA